jgi:hypothetical protein
MLHYIERDPAEPMCRRCECPESWCQCEPDIDRFPEDPVQTDTQQQRALASHDPVQEPWHLEPDDHSAEERKEADYAYIVRECQDFISRHGASALMRCVGEALR